MNEPLSLDVLHMGNIVNNGYLHAKYLRMRGVGAHNLNVDYTHCQGAPEWTDALIKEPVAEWDQDWSRLDLGGYRRPDWYHGIMIADVPRAEAVLANWDEGPALAAAGAMRGAAGAAFERALSSARALAARMVRGVAGQPAVDQIKSVVEVVHPANVTTEFAEQIVRDFAAAYPDAPKPLTLAEVILWGERSVKLARLFKFFKVIQGYSLDPIYAMLGTPDKPFLCYEHGTMRDFPYEDAPRGRLYALALKKAHKVFITNADCIASARRLGLTNWVYIPHLIDDQRYRPADSPVRPQLTAETGADFVIVAPARHHWKNVPPGMEGMERSWHKRNNVLIEGLGHLIARRSELKVMMVFFEWGQEVALSKALIDQVGLTSRVKWVPIQCKLAMKDYFNAADVVCDQFHPGIAAFGAVVGEALACGKPVISNLNRETNAEAFPVLPPILHATEPQQVEAHLERLIDDEVYRRQAGAESRAWYLAQHSSKVVTDRMIAVYEELSDRHGWNWRFA
jgi:glycosyltransferase involved in cell wall biosynthesis